LDFQVAQLLAIPVNSCRVDYSFYTVKFEHPSSNSSQVPKSQNPKWPPATIFNFNFWEFPAHNMYSHYSGHHLAKFQHPSSNGSKLMDDFRNQNGDQRPS